MRKTFFAAFAVAALGAGGAFAQATEASPEAPAAAVEAPAGTTTTVNTINGTTTITIPDQMPDGRAIWKEDAAQTHASGPTGDQIPIGSLIAKMVVDAATADEMCRGGIQGTDARATGCAVRDYLYSAMGELNICEDRILDEQSGAFVRVYAECTAR